MQTLDEAIIKVVTWWSDKAFRTPLNQNNGDDSEQGGIVFALMNMASTRAQETVSEEKIKRFEEVLTKSLRESEPYFRTIDVDYHPCTMLAYAVEQADIDGHCLPCKSETRIDKDNEAWASYQYGGSWQKL